MTIVLEMTADVSFSVFWDLYCAAPERRDNCEHSSEAKAFHDYVSASLLTVRFLTCVRAAGRQQRAQVSNAYWPEGVD